MLIWQLPQQGPQLLGDLDSPLEPFTSASPFSNVPLSSVAWLGSSETKPVLLVGDATNARLALLGVDQGAASPPTLQTLQLASSAAPTNEAIFNHLAVLPAQGLIILANTRGNAIYAVSLSRDGSRFAHFSQFPVTTPILSLAARMVDEEGPSQGKAQLACTQTQVIPPGQLLPASGLP